MHLRTLKINALVIILTALFLFNPINSKNSSLNAKTKNDDIGFTQSGIASWYGPGFQGRKTASGERFNTHDMTAAHKTLSFGSLVKVTNQENGKSVVVKINDRGPFIRGRIIDLSHAAKEELGMGGLADVIIEVIDPDAPESEESTELTTVTLFENMLPANSQVIIEYTKQEGQESNEQLNQLEVNEIFGSMNKINIKVITPGVNTKSISYTFPDGTYSPEQKPEVGYMDVTSKIKSLTGLTFKVAQVADKEQAYELIGNLESNGFQTIMMEETITTDSRYYTIYAGNYEFKSQSRSDKRKLIRMDIAPMLVRIAG
jgi:rare lipoprotein A